MCKYAIICAITDTFGHHPSSWFFGLLSLYWKKYKEAYEIALLSVYPSVCVIYRHNFCYETHGITLCVCVTPLFFVFYAVRVVLKYAIII
jgi:hypothetical protein